MKESVLVIALAVLLAACNNPLAPDTPSEVDSAAIEEACLQAGGTFVAEHIECEQISEGACTDMGGVFDECGSPCRHEPEDVICAAMCVPVCSFDAAP
jgi:hypothetical protein